ncbi:sensor histidine kinase [Paenibacillus sp. IITD108]|uniref:sensor histidine kinase n=1 Tax=Paenibacillus sp. IITD108 TaxID=3116649 RepID=UPI002F404559
MERSNRDGISKQKGYRKGYSLIAVISAAAAVFAWFVASAAAQSLHDRELEIARLYWNGYAKLYAEQNNGELTGLSERLQKDQYMFGSNQRISVIFYDPDGKTPVAATQNGIYIEAAEGLEQQLRHLDKMSVLSDGKITGYIAVYLEQSLYLRLLAGLFTGSSAVSVIVAGFIVIRRSKAAFDKARLETASLLYRQMTDKDIKEALVAEILQSESRKLSHSECAVRVALQSAAEQLERINKLETVRRTMVADIAHELRTPIAVMRSQLEHAISDNVPLPVEKAARLHDETLRLTKLVRDLQVLALAESGNLPLAKSWFSLTEVVSQVVETLALEAEERAIKTDMKSPHELMIYADESRIRQMIINLTGNALEHARSSVRIIIGINESKTMVHIVVQDDGMGMEEEELGRVFDRFYRGKRNNKSKSGSSGLGLGLAIAREFAHAHRGTVEVASRYGEGTRFFVELPIMND